MRQGQKQTPSNGSYVELTALKYDGPVPKPHAACTEPTPDEQYRLYMEQKNNDLGAREQRNVEETMGSIGHKSGSSSVSEMFVNATTNLRSIAQMVALKVERAGTGVTAATESAVRQFDQQLKNDRFTNNFPELAAMGEVLLADYPCSAMHTGVRVSGHVHISKNYLCFSSQNSSKLAQATTQVLKETGLIADRDSVLGIRQIIPLTEIACILLSVALETVDQRSPFFLPIPTSDVLPTSLQVYTTKQQLFQFFAFESIASTAGAVLSEAVKGRPIDRAYNYLDHAWRASTAVPLPGVNYAN